MNGESAEAIGERVQKALAELMQACTWRVLDERGIPHPNPKRLDALDQIICIETTLSYMVWSFKPEEYLAAKERMQSPAPAAKR